MSTNSNNESLARCEICSDLILTLCRYQLVPEAGRFVRGEMVFRWCGQSIISFSKWIAINTSRSVLLPSPPTHNSKVCKSNKNSTHRFCGTQYLRGNVNYCSLWKWTKYSKHNQPLYTWLAVKSHTKENSMAAEVNQFNTRVDIVYSYRWGVVRVWWKYMEQRRNRPNWCEKWLTQVYAVKSPPHPILFLNEEAEGNVVFEAKSNNNNRPIVLNKTVVRLRSKQNKVNETGYNCPHCDIINVTGLT